MRQFRVPEIVLAAIFGLIFGIGVAEVSTYQAHHCQDGGSAQPSLKQPIDAPDRPRSGEQKPNDYYQRHPIACEIGGVAPSFVAYMDEHEGFFVGLFTGLLFVATIGLWRSTNALWDTSERQIGIAGKAADAADRSARTAELALLSVEIPYLYPYVRTHGINVEIVGETETPQIKSFDYGNEFITYYFKNFGRTPAEIIEVFSVIHLGMGHPPPITVPSVPFIRLSGVVVADGGESENFPRDLTEPMYQTIYRGGFNPEMDLVWFLAMPDTVMFSRTST